MNDTTTDTSIVVDRLRAALASVSAPATYNPDDNPLAHLGVAELSYGIGLTKTADNYPAVNKGDALDSVRIEGMANGRADRSAKRKAVARARQQRRDQINAIERVAVRPDAERLKLAWEVVALMRDTIASVSRVKAQYAGRYLGNVSGDLTQMVCENIALILAKDDRHDLGVLVQAATEMAAGERGRRIPADQLSVDERKQRKAIGQARKWIMSVINTRVHDTLADLYRERDNLRWENIDVLDTVMAQVRGPEADPMMKRFQADKAPTFMGTRFAAPGRMDGNLLATAIMAAITERGLDPIAELLLHEDFVRADGAIKWAEAAELIFRATPGGQGGDVWLAVERATAQLADPRGARADAARKHVRNLFAWLPSVVVAVVDAFDQYEVSCTWVDGSGPHSRLASTFESYLPASDGVRRPLAPALRFATTDEAAQAIALHLSVLLTGEDYLAQLVQS